MKNKIYKIIVGIFFILVSFNFVLADNENTKDTTAPVIFLTGSENVSLNVGDEYVDNGATATDDIDGDITKNITSYSTVDTSVVGNYSVTYSVSDKAGNIATQVIRNIIVNNIIVTPPAPVYYDISVKDNCTVVDTDGVSHIFPVENSENKFLGICALVSAKEANYINSFELVNDPSMGLYLKNINDTVLGQSEYWALWLNGEFAICGVGCLPVAVDDKLDLVLTDWMTSAEITKILLRINFLENTPIIPPAPSGSNGGSSSTTLDKKFSIPNALAFLSSNQKSDGSFGAQLYTDWVAIALSTQSNSNIKSNLVSYLKSNPLNSSVATDNERRAMALMALGVNPYNGTDVNYIKKIIDSFDGVQFGDDSLVNDDIFALIVLSKAGYSSSDDIIKRNIDFIISEQSPDGSWGSVDMTAAAIEALYNYKRVSGVFDSISRGFKYIKDHQLPNGGFTNSSSTSWAIQALILEGGTYSIEINNALEYLSSLQQSDGGVDDVLSSISSRIWTTSYAIPAVDKLSWSDMLNEFDRPEEIISTNKNLESNDNIIIQTEESTLKKEEVESIESKTDKTSLLPIRKNKEVKKILVQKDMPEKENSKEGIASNNLENNSLSASVALSGVGDMNNGSILLSIFTKIKVLFKWLWVHLGF